jgi:hypothetical protein
MRYSTSWEVAGSSPDEDLHFLIYLIFPATLGLGVYSASVTGISTRNRKIMFLESRARSAHKADNFTAI